MSLEFLKSYERLSSQSPDHVSIISKDYVYLVVNDSYVLAHGMERAEIIGKKVPDLLGRQPFDDFVKSYLDRCFDGEVINYRCWFEFRSAGKRFMDVTYFPYHGHNDVIAGAVVSARDITGYRLADDKLRESEEKYRHLFDNLNDAVFLADIGTGRVTETNIQGEALMGRRRDEIIGMHQSEFHPPGKSEEYRRRFAAHIANGRAADYDGEVVKKDGTIVPVRIGASPLTIGGKHLILGIFRNISEKQRAQEALLESKRFSESLINSMKDGFAILDRERRFLDGNPAFFEMTGFTKEELTGRKLPMPYWAGEDVERILGMFEELSAGKTGDFEFTFINKGGNRFPVIVSPSVLLDRDGNIVNYFATIKDITYRKNMEQEFLRSQKLESLGILAGGIAHDFNNLLTGILSNISLALHHNSGDRAAKMLQEAEKASLRAKALVQQFLTFAKGGGPIKKTVFIGALIRETSDFAVTGSNVKCEYSISGDLLPVEADEGMLAQALHNIILNAAQAMPDGGVINVCASNVTMNGGHARLREGPHVRITVQDHGMGISEENLSRIFDPYFTTKSEGCGLGLATTYSIINNHNGSIEVKTRPGGGTLFTIYLRASENIPEASLSESAPVSACSVKGKVLLMDDEPLIRFAAGEILTNAGCSVELAKDGSEAISLYQRAGESGKPFDLVIMDLTVPAGTGGKEAAKRVLEINPGARVVVSSGYSNDPILSDFRSYGFIDVITKPYRATDMVELVRRLIGG